MDKTLCIYIHAWHYRLENIENAVMDMAKVGLPNIFRAGFMICFGDS